MTHVEATLGAHAMAAVASTAMSAAVAVNLANNIAAVLHASTDLQPETVIRASIEHRRRAFGLDLAAVEVDSLVRLMASAWRESLPVRVDLGGGRGASVVLLIGDSVDLPDDPTATEEED